GAIDNYSATVRFDGRANFQPVGGVDPDTTTFYRKHYRGRIFDELWLTWNTRFPFTAARVRDKLGETFCNYGGRISFAIALNRRLQQFGHPRQDVDSTILRVAAKANYCRNVQVEFPKRFGQSVGGPILLLTRDARAGTEISDQAGLG